MTSELNIFVDENNVEAGGREILTKVRPEWQLDLVKFKVSRLIKIKKVIKNEEKIVGSQNINHTTTPHDSRHI